MIRIHPVLFSSRGKLRFNIQIVLFEFRCLVDHEDSGLILTTDYFHEFIRVGRKQLRTCALFEDQREMVISIILIHVLRCRLMFY
jgi:hypothetical protein